MNAIFISLVGLRVLALAIPNPQGGKGEPEFEGYVEHDNNGPTVTVRELRDGNAYDRPRNKVTVLELVKYEARRNAVMALAELQYAAAQKAAS